MEKKRFKIHEGKATSFGVVAFLCSIASLYVCTEFVSGFDDNPLLYVVLCVGGSIILGIVAAVVSKNQYFQVLDDGFEIIEGKKVTKYDFADFAGSNVVKHYTNGIPTGTTREIKIQKPNEKLITINANSLSEKQFAELVSYLGKTEYEQTHNEEIPVDLFREKVIFTIPSEEIVKTNKSKLIMYSVSAGICAIIGVVTLSFFSSTSFVVVGAMSIAGAIALGLLGIIPWAAKVIDLRTIPGKVTIDEWGITVDDKVYSASDITNVSMVPATYKILTRDLIITTSDGVKHIYNFGKNEGKDKYTFKDYPELQGAVKVWCITKKISFMSLLG